MSRFFFSLFFFFGGGGGVHQPIVHYAIVSGLLITSIKAGGRGGTVVSPALVGRGDGSRPD